MPIWASDVGLWVGKLVGAFLIGWGIGLSMKYWQKLLDLINGG